MKTITLSAAMLLLTLGVKAQVISQFTNDRCISTDIKITAVYYNGTNCATYNYGTTSVPANSSISGFTASSTHPLLGSTYVFVGFKAEAIDCAASSGECATEDPNNWPNRHSCMGSLSNSNINSSSCDPGCANVEIHFNWDPGASTPTWEAVTSG